MTAIEAHRMLLFHQRHARAYRLLAADPTVPKRERERCKDNAHSAEMRAAECQAICQVARITEGEN